MIPVDLIIFASVSGFISALCIADKIITSAHRHGKLPKFLKWKSNKLTIEDKKPEPEYKDDVIDLTTCFIELISAVKK